MPLRTPLMNVMVLAAEKAGKALKRDFGEVEHLQVSRKGPSDFVTAADVKTEKLLVAELTKARPAFGFVNEEAGVIAGSDPDHRWIIDPIDGTTNFIHGIPQFAMSIALQRGTEIIAGLVYNPITDEMFTAEKGTGAFLNNRRLRVSARRTLDDVIVGTGTPFKGRPNHDEFLAQCARVIGATAGIRRFGAASLDLAYVAAGRFDAFWEMNLKPWDMAAGMLLVTEAGGFVSDLMTPGSPLDTGNILATNAELQTSMRKLVLG
ncbi:MAG: inositol monophosphatase [Rhodospirillaceae bacterium]|nr:inositol monophosphatase [Rhodospirillaceae bacterium]